MHYSSKEWLDETTMSNNIYVRSRFFFINVAPFLTDMQKLKFFVSETRTTEHFQLGFIT